MKRISSHVSYFKLTVIILFFAGGFLLYGVLSQDSQDSQVKKNNTSKKWEECKVLVSQLGTPDTIDGLRKDIDIVNRQLLLLLNKRAEIVIKIGKIKKQKNMPIYAPAREAAIYRKIVEKNQGPLTDEAVIKLFKAIIDESKRLQQKVFN